MSIILALLTFVMFILALGIIGLVLLQKSSGQQGLGAAICGGVADEAFGAETYSILSNISQIATIIYFVLAFVLYLGYQSMYADEESAEGTGLLDAAIQEEAAVESEEAIGTEEVDAATIEEVVDSVEEATTVNPLEDTIEPQE